MFGLLGEHMATYSAMSNRGTAEFALPSMCYALYRIGRGNHWRLAGAAFCAQADASGKKEALDA